MSEANSIRTHPISYPSVGKYNLFVFWNFLGLLCKPLLVENFVLRLEHISKQVSFQSSTNVSKPIKKSVSHIGNSCLSSTSSFAILSFEQLNINFTTFFALNNLLIASFSKANCCFEIGTIMLNVFKIRIAFSNSFGNVSFPRCLICVVLPHCKLLLVQM